jgi:demethylmenaquinone methyltransferase/2-methoxy-6-polyprenyl-1,4-benzoquinol methylase
VKKCRKKDWTRRLFLELGDSENLPYADNTFDAITVAFGVRNFQNFQNGLRDMMRVLKPGGQLVVLEFSTPKALPIQTTVLVLFQGCLPTIGKLISKDPRAYTYLPESVAAFPYGAAFEKELVDAGLNPVKTSPSLSA